MLLSLYFFFFSSAKVICRLSPGSAFSHDWLSFLIMKFICCYTTHSHPLLGVRSKLSFCHTLLLICCISWGPRSCRDLLLLPSSPTIQSNSFHLLLPQFCLISGLLPPPLQSSISKSPQSRHLSFFTLHPLSTHHHLRSLQSGCGGCCVTIISLPIAEDSPGR